MNLLASLVFLMLSYADDTDEYGTLHVVRGDRPVKTLIVVNNKVLASDWMTVFKYDPVATTLSISRRTFLSVNDKGKLATSYQKESGFFISPVSKNLYFNGTDVFFICADESMEQQGNCAGAQQIVLQYESFPIVGPSESEVKSV